MTVNVKKSLEKIYDSDIFDDELYFVGGTALSYYLKHRISENIDIISNTTLNYKQIIPSMSIVGAKKLPFGTFIILKVKDISGFWWIIFTICGFINSTFAITPPYLLEVRL